MKISVLSDVPLAHGGHVPEHHPEADVIGVAGDLAPYTEGLVDRLAEHWSSARSVQRHLKWSGRSAHCR